MEYRKLYDIPYSTKNSFFLSTNYITFDIIRSLIQVESIFLIHLFIAQFTSFLYLAWFSTPSLSFIYSFCSIFHPAILNHFFPIQLGGVLDALCQIEQLIRIPYVSENVQKCFKKSDRDGILPHISYGLQKFTYYSVFSINPLLLSFSQRTISFLRKWF